MVLHDSYYFNRLSNCTDIDLCTYATKKHKDNLIITDKTIIGRVIANCGLTDDYSIIKSGDREAIIKLIKQKVNEYYWCIKLIEQDEELINYIILKNKFSLEYIDWNLVINFKNTNIIKECLRYNISYLQFINPALIVGIIEHLNLLQIDSNLSFITNSDLDFYYRLIEYNSYKYYWGLKFIKQSDELCLSVVKCYGFALKYVKNKTNNLCLTAIKGYYGNIVYVKKQNRILRLCATKISIFSLNYIAKQNIELLHRYERINNFYILLPKIYKNIKM